MTLSLNLSRSIHFEAVGTPIPWSAPLVGRFGGARKKPELIEWQEKVGEAARDAWPYEPSVEPIYLYCQFTIRSDDESLHGQLCYPRFKWIPSHSRWKKLGKALPDSTNLLKAVEDGIQGTIFLNDNQVCAQEIIRLWGSEPGVKVNVGIICPDKPFLDLF
jgi:Holliday junction resolvase RusA-like endonuclease